MRTCAFLLALVVAAVVPALAQQPRPIPPAVVDIRGFYSKLGQDSVTANTLGLQPADLPARGLGGVANVTFFPLRRRAFAFGIGGEAILIHGNAQKKDEKGMPVGSPVHQALRGLGAAISFNFGHRDGWSYLSAGAGPQTFATYVGTTAPVDPPPSTRTLNMGGGGRWFNTAHVAFTFDVRFYLTRPAVTTAAYPGRERKRLLIMSAGIALK